MTLHKYKLGELLELSNERNTEGKFTLEDVRGISIQKIFIETKADMAGVSLTPYILVKPDAFAYVPVTSRNGGKITIAHNNTDNTYIVSTSYVVFSVKRTDILLSDYLFMYFNRSEFDRYARFHSLGSAREVFSWDDMCNVDMLLPPLDIQRKYVNVYLSMTTNQRAYEKGLDELKLVCDMYIEDLRRKMPCEKIGEYIVEVNERNEAGHYGLEDVRGVSIAKRFIKTVADMNGVNLQPYYVISPNDFAYNTVTSRMGDKLAIALNDTDNTYICSSSYVVFRCRDENILLPQYLMLYFTHSEFDRYARFHSIGSAREIFSFDDMCNVQIPIPDMTIQRSIANIYTVYKARKAISERLKVLIKETCPVLIKGAIDEAQKEDE